MFPAKLLPSAIADLFVQATRSGRIALADRYGLLVALLDGETSPEELRAIDRLLYAFRRGRIALSDELSNLDED